MQVLIEEQSLAFPGLVPAWSAESSFIENYHKRIYKISIFNRFFLCSLQAGSDVFLRNIDGRTARPGNHILMCFCCTMLHDVARCCTMLHEVARCCTMLHEVARCCTMLHVCMTCARLPTTNEACFKRKPSHIKTPQKGGGRGVQSLSNNNKTATFGLPFANI